MTKHSEYALANQSQYGNCGYQSQPVEKVLTFAGATTNDPGDYDGTGNPSTLFTVTGPVLIKLLAVCTTTLTGASSTIEVGIAGDTTALLPLTVGTTIAEDEIWHDATVDAKIEASTIASEYILNNENIILTVRTANVTAGAIKFLLSYVPLADGAMVVAA